MTNFGVNRLVLRYPTRFGEYTDEERERVDELLADGLLEAINALEDHDFGPDGLSTIICFQAPDGKSPVIAEMDVSNDDLEHLKAQVSQYAETGALLDVIHSCSADNLSRVSSPGLAELASGDARGELS